ncbi:MAG: hypothetical protein ABSB49_04660 [Polyangia bacterium]|jgi:hypothetical protein
MPVQVVAPVASLSHAPAPGYRQLAAFFIPLALQSASQSLTYPLVAMVASHGAGGTLNLAGVAQSNIVMFLVGTIGAGLVSTGMVYGKSRLGYSRFFAVNALLAVAAAVVQALICVPAIGHAVFGTLLGLPHSIEVPARRAFPLTIILNLLFFARNPFEVLLLNHGAAGRVSAATLARIVLTLVLAHFFVVAGLVGPRWAIICQAIPVAVEAAIAWYCSRPFASLFARDDDVPGRRAMIGFNLPLSLGGFFLTTSGMILAAVIARSSRPEHMLPAYYLAVGLANPMAFAAARVQNVVLRFPPRSRADRLTRRFTLGAGSIVSFIPLVFLLPFLSHWYYVSLQQLSPVDLPLVTVTALLLVGYPFTAGLRAHWEGLAALARRTSTILAGNIAFVAALAITAPTCLGLKVSGNMIGPIALIISNLAALGVLVLLQSLPEGSGPVDVIGIEREGG